MIVLDHRCSVMWFEVEETDARLPVYRTLRDFLVGRSDHGHDYDLTFSLCVVDEDN